MIRIKEVKDPPLQVFCLAAQCLCDAVHTMTSLRARGARGTTLHHLAVCLINTHPPVRLQQSIGPRLLHMERPKNFAAKRVVVLWMRTILKHEINSIQNGGIYQCCLGDQRPILFNQRQQAAAVTCHARFG
jgi:hypothetical protein